MRQEEKIAQAAEVDDLSGLSGTFGCGERGAEAPLYPSDADTSIVEPLLAAGLAECWRLMADS
jgi:hypothetical protein